MKRTAFTHLVGFDDAPFPPAYRGAVLVVGTVYGGEQLAGVLSGTVDRDGSDATRVLAELVASSRFYPQLHAVLLQGIALAGFNVVDIHGLHDRLGLPVLVVARRRPDRAAVRAALLDHVIGGADKWRLIERTGEMEPLAGVYVQRVGIGRDQAEGLIHASARYGRIPEPLRAAHLIAGGIGTGHSRGRT
jgi:endonuclease V-like protein UPF0215 family